MGTYLNMNNAVLLESVETNRTIIQVWGTQYAIAVPHTEERIFVVRAFNKKTGECKLRFGNQIQVRSIMNTYRKEKRFHL